MKSATTRLLSLVLAASGVGCGGAFAADRVERVTLSEGTTALKGSIEGRDSVQYTFSARPGQELAIRLATSNASNYINVERADVDQALCQGAMTGNVCLVRSESSAEYLVDVFLMRNAARRAEKASYTLTINSGDAAAAQAGVAPKDAAAGNAAAAAVAACKSALALKSGQNAVFVLPLSHVAAAGGYEVFLSLKSVQWLCTTDPRGNVNRMEQR